MWDVPSVKRQRRLSQDLVDGEDLGPLDVYVDGQARRESRRWIWLTTANLLICFLSVIFATSSTRGRACYESGNEALKASWTYSPVLEDPDLHLVDTKIRSSPYGEEPSPWRGLPNDTEAQAAWNQFSPIRPLALTAADVRRMGKDPSKAARFEDPIWQMGDDAYVGALDFFHQVHCFKSIRDAAFADLDEAEQASKKEQGWVYWFHLQHCVDNVMQHLLCTADTGMVTYQWQEVNEHPFPDIMVQRQCKDWKALERYRDQHAVDLKKFKQYTKTALRNEGVVFEEIPKSKEFWAMAKQHGYKGDKAPRL